MNSTANSDLPTAIGTTVSFYDWLECGEEVRVQGIVEDEFYEPEGEDSYGRLNYRVRLQDGTCRTPYAYDCRPVREN